jgi:hypothetical protein
VSWKRLLPPFCLYAALGSLMAFWLHRAEISAPTEGDLFDPELRTLLQLSSPGDEEHHFRFLPVLDSVLKRNGLSVTDYDPYYSPILGSIPGGYAVKIRHGLSCRVIAVLHVSDIQFPGTDTQNLILFDCRGRLLDSLTCAIGNRLIWFESTKFVSEVPPSRTADGALVVVRFIPSNGQEPSRNWHYRITHRNRNYKILCGDSDPERLRSADWSKKGLARVSVREDRFAVLFPILEKATSEQ